MQLKTIIYTTSRVVWFKNEFEKMYEVIRRSRGVTVHPFKTVYFKLPENVPTLERSNGGVYVDWDWFKKNLPHGENNAVCLHITRRERDVIGMKHSSPGKALGGVYDKNSNDGVFRFVVIADRRSQSYDGMSTFMRIFLHELSHGFAHWRNVIDYTHLWDGLLKNIRGIFFLHDFSTWNALIAQIKTLTNKVNFLKSQVTQLHPPVDAAFMDQISQPFGVRNSIYPLTGHHVGTDFRTPVGENCHALTDGEVVNVIENHPVLGNATYFKYTWQGQTYTSRYLHQSRTGTLGLKKRGENVGVTGNTGMSTGPHIHFDTSRGDFSLFGLNSRNFRNKFVDPMSFKYEGVSK